MEIFKVFAFRVSGLGAFIRHRLSTPVFHLSECRASADPGRCWSVHILHFPEPQKPACKSEAGQHSFMGVLWVLGLN